MTSIGVTATTASVMPAINPLKKVVDTENDPSFSLQRLLKYSNTPNLKLLCVIGYQKNQI